MDRTPHALFLPPGTLESARFTTQRGGRTRLGPRGTPRAFARPRAQTIIPLFSLVAQLYEQFVSNFEGRLSQLQFVLILTQVATQYYPSRPVSVPGEHERL